jgi:GNAT superfamily N-acetyltransferase
LQIRRSRGAGRALIEAVYAAAAANGAERVYRQTQEGNATARPQDSAALTAGAPVTIDIDLGGRTWPLGAMNAMLTIKRPTKTTAAGGASSGACVAIAAA